MITEILNKIGSYRIDVFPNIRFLRYDIIVKRVRIKINDFKKTEILLPLDFLPHIYNLIYTISYSKHKRF